MDVLKVFLLVLLAKVVLATKSVPFTKTCDPVVMKAGEECRCQLIKKPLSIFNNIYPYNWSTYNVAYNKNVPAERDYKVIKMEIGRTKWETINANNTDQSRTLPKGSTRALVCGFVVMKAGERCWHLSSSNTQVIPNFYRYCTTDNSAYNKSFPAARYLRVIKMKNGITTRAAINTTNINLPRIPLIYSECVIGIKTEKNFSILFIVLCTICLLPPSSILLFIYRYVTVKMSNRKENKSNGFESPERNCISSAELASDPESMPTYNIHTVTSDQISVVAEKQSISLNAEPSKPGVMDEGVNETTERSLCKVCLDEDMCVIFLPCRHLATCKRCADMLDHCAVCRSLIGGTFTVPF